MNQNNLTLLDRYNSPIEASLIKTKLESEGIESYVFDEHSIGINPLVSNALGGVKLMVRESDLDQSIIILKELKETPYLNEDNQIIVCPNCESSKVNRYSSMKEKSGLIGILLSIIFVVYPPFVSYILKCDSCGHEFTDN